MGQLRIGQLTSGWNTVNIHGNTTGHSLIASSIKLDNGSINIQDTDVTIKVYDKFDIEYSGFLGFNSSNFQNTGDQWNLEFESTGGSSPRIYVEQSSGFPNAYALTKAKVTVKSGSNLSLEAYAYDSTTSFGGSYSGFIDEILLEDNTSLTLNDVYNSNEAVYVDHLSLATTNTSFYSNTSGIKSTKVNLYYNTISMENGDPLPAGYTLPSFIINFGSGSTTIPEPTSLALLTLAGIATLRRKSA